MPKINQALLDKLQKTLGLKKSQVYRLIEIKMTETHLDRHLAAIALASDHKIGIAKFATSEELAIIRGANPAPSKVESTSIPTPIVKRIIRPSEAITVNLDFISSVELHNILVRDVAELNVAISQGLEKTAKTCMILSGSITEAILLDQLMQVQPAAVAIGTTLPKRLSSNLEDWDLHDLVTVATLLTPPLLSDDTTTGASQLRRWRNLIHPGRELKDARNKRIMPTPARARSSISFLRLVVEELGG